MRGRNLTAAACATAILAAAVAGAVRAGDKAETDGTAAKVRIADLGWLAGEWTSDEDGAAFDELWTAPRGDAMFAVSRLVQDGATGLCELSAIEQTGDGLVLRIRHFSRSLEPWKSDAAGPLTMTLVESAAKKLVFEDAKRAFPRRIAYEREGEVLTALLEGEKDGKPVNERFELKLAPRNK
jgi:uncharacterized protein DUF6265